MPKDWWKASRDRKAMRRAMQPYPRGRLERQAEVLLSKPAPAKNKKVKLRAHGKQAGKFRCHQCGQVVHFSRPPRPEDWPCDACKIGYSDGRLPPETVPDASGRFDQQPSEELDRMSQHMDAITRE